MSSHVVHRRVPWFLWPFWAVWRLLTFVLEFTGRTVGVVIGLVLVIGGALVSLTLVGAIVGIPLAGVGLLLIVRCMF